MEIRKAFIGEQCAVVPKLIAGSAQEVVERVYTSKHKTAQGFIDYSYGRNTNFFSYGIHHFVRMECQTVGCFATYSDKEFAKLTRGFLRSLFSFYGPIRSFGPLYRAIKLSKTAPPPPRDSLYICNMSVLPEFRGRGLGKALMQRAIQLSQEQGFAKAALDVDITNSSAIALYEKLGFTIESKNTINSRNWPTEGNYRMIRLNTSAIHG